MKGLGYRVQGSGFGVQGSGFRVQGAGFRVQGAGVRALRAPISLSVRGSRFQGALCKCPIPFLNQTVTVVSAKLLPAIQQSLNGSACEAHWVLHPTP